MWFGNADPERLQREAEKESRKRAENFEKDVDKGVPQWYYSINQFNALKR